MCWSCYHKYEGKFLQQCKICGDCAHEPYQCSCGSDLFYRDIHGNNHQRNCSCPFTESYDIQPDNEDFWQSSYDKNQKPYPRYGRVNEQDRLIEFSKF